MVILHVRVKNEISESLILVSGPKSKVGTTVRKENRNFQGRISVTISTGMIALSTA